MNNSDYYQPELVARASPDPRLPEDRNPGGALLVRVPNWLGDCLIAMPALYQLKQELGDTRKLVVLCRDNLEPLWAMTDWVDQIIAFPQSRVKSETLAMIRHIQAGIALVLPNSFGSALDLAGSQIPVRIGYPGNLRRWLLTHHATRWSKCGQDGCEHHQANQYFDLVEIIRPVRRQLPAQGLLTIEPDKIERVRRRLKLASPDHRPLIAMAPGAAYGPAKQWPVDYYHHTAVECVKAGYSIMILGTGREWAIGRQICQDLAGTVNLCGQTSLPELACLLKLASLCLCNDSGTMHLAAGLGRPGIAVFGSTSAAATGPLGRRWRVFTSQATCSPCFRRDCNRQDNRFTCLRETTPQIVCQAIFSLLHQANREAS